MLYCRAVGFIGLRCLCNKTVDLILPRLLVIVHLKVKCILLKSIFSLLYGILLKLLLIPLQ